MKPLFYKLSPKERSDLLDTIYTSMLAINLLFLQNLLSASPEQFITIALANFAVGIPASAGAVLARHIHQQSTRIDRTLGMIAFFNTSVGICAALWRFSPQIGLTFIGLTIGAAIMLLIGHDLYPVSPAPNDQQTDPQTHPAPSTESPQVISAREKKKRRRR